MQEAGTLIRVPRHQATTLCEPPPSSLHPVLHHRCIPVRRPHYTDDHGCGKVHGGRLRPHFISVCEPNSNLYNCSDGYIDWNVCTGDEELIKAARLSFPSGHSSFSWYCAVYFVVYMEARFIWDFFSHLLKPVLQLGALVLALLTALSRISDYKHHWGDVLVGSALGATVAIVLFFYTSHLSKFPRPKSSTGELEENEYERNIESYDLS
ncbi:phospholipid phosphatase 1-like isoform X1 [Ptychodera flava]|uniref:phospholipid phosphatase 1-like isoform X1 n=1 Tax=Ptychodera flava TaxID=63121 RepID=UPI00396A40C6